MHVRGFKEEGTTTTPFDMVVLNELDRFHLAQDAVERLPKLSNRLEEFKEQVDKKIAEHKQYISQYGQDMPEIRNWRWSLAKT
jgi:xylulose-5-phosphate/fructose-6-phosphate phosphoketolase